MRTPKVERKIEYFPIIGGQVKATNDDQGIIEGYLNYIGNIDFGDDRTMKGAFRKTLQDSYSRKSAQGLDYLWPYLWNHDYNILPPGGIFDANEDKNGLYIKTQFNMETQLGRELYSSFKQGMMKKQSMGYRAIQVEWVKDDGRSIRNLLEVAVMEGSAVVFPMNDLAAVEVVKGRQAGRPCPYCGKLDCTCGKARSFYMPTRTLTDERKDYAADYLQTSQQDWVSDLWNLWYPLRNAIVNAFVMGDQPADDVQAALDQFSTATLAYVQRGLELDITDYLQPSDDDLSNPNSGNYNYMTAADNPETKDTKAGRVLSAANHAMLTKAVQGIQGHVTQMKSLLTQAQQQGYPQANTSASPTPRTKQNEEDAEISTLLASLKIKNAFR